MFALPVFAEGMSAHAQMVMEASVRTLWLEFMACVVGGIGSAYLLREGWVRVPALVAMLPRVRSFESQEESAQIESGVRVGVSN